MDPPALKKQKINGQVSVDFTNLPNGVFGLILKYLTKQDKHNSCLVNRKWSRLIRSFTEIISLFGSKIDLSERLRFMSRAFTNLKSLVLDNVSALDTENLKLIPKSIVSLEIGHCNFNNKHVSKLPRDIQNLELIDCPNLQRNNGFHKLPSRLRQLRLRNITVSNVALKALVEANLTHLTSLEILYCKTTDKAIEELKPLTQLQKLHIRSPLLTSAGIANIPSSITDLDLAISNKNSLQQGYHNFPTDLLTLRLNTVKVKDGLQTLSRCTRLQSLNLQNCRELSDEHFKHLPPSIIHLDLSSSDIEDSSLSYLPPSLQILRLERCGISNQGIKNLLGSSCASTLKTLDIAGCRKITQSAFNNAKNVSHLDIVVEPESL